MIRATTSASNIFRRALCPGSERMEEGLPDEESAQSKEGDLLHALDANPAIDRALLKPEQRDLLKLSADLENIVLQRATEQFGIGPDEPYTQGVEQELFVHRGIQTLIPGHCDKWRYYHRLGLLLILDKKFGYKEVTPAAANYQLRTYACGAAELWPKVEDVIVAITQPRLPYEQRVTMAHYTRADLEPAKAELQAIKEACAQPDALLTATEEGCRYCKAKLICPAFQKKIQDGLALVPFPNGEHSAPARQAHIERTLAALPDDKLEQVLVGLEMAEFIKEPARDEGRRRVASGQLLTRKLGKSSVMRSVADPAQAIALLTLGGKLTREEVLACSEPKLGRLETRLREKTGCTWDVARETIDSTLAPVLERTEKKPSLVKVKA